MDKLFLDANIIFSATLSSHGASRAIFQLAENLKIKTYSSIYAIKEAKINIERKLGTDYLPIMFNLISNLKKIDKRECNIDKSIYGELIVAKDIPILESALSQKVDFLVTLDRKDFMTEKIKAAGLPFEIVLPGDYLRSYLDRSMG